MQNSKFQFKIQKSSNLLGFTLIELLVAAGVVITVGGIMASIMVSALRGVNKSNTLTDARQNGSFVIAQTTKILRYAKQFDGVSTDNVTYTTDCTVPAVNPTPTPVPYTYARVTSFDGGQTTIGCISTAPATISSNSASLVNTTAVVVSNCYFTCTQSLSDGLITLDLDFTLSSNTTSLLNERKASPVPFSTSVTFRNLGR